MPVATEVGRTPLCASPTAVLAAAAIDHSPSNMDTGQTTTLRQGE